MLTPVKAPAVRQQEVTSNDEDNLAHIVRCHDMSCYFCPNDLIALCGADLAETVWDNNPALKEQCIVCEDLYMKGY